MSILDALLLSKLIQILRRFCNTADGKRCRAHLIALGDLLQLSPMENTVVFGNPQETFLMKKLRIKSCGCTWIQHLEMLSDCCNADRKRKAGGK